jgi:hypothetical protein
VGRGIRRPEPVRIAPPDPQDSPLEYPPISAHMHYLPAVDGTRTLLVASGLTLATSYT